MAWVQEFSGTRNTSGTSITLTVPTGGIAKGDFLVLGFATNNSVLPTASVADTAGNTWVEDQSILVGTSAAGFQFHCKMATALAAGNTITITLGTSSSRVAASCQHFDDLVVASDVGASNNNGGSSSSSWTSTATATTASDQELLVGAFHFVSSSRVFSTSDGSTVGTKVVTSGGSGERAVQMQWRTLTATGTYSSAGTITGGGALYGATVQTYRNRTGQVKVWNGSAWVKRSTKVWNGSAWVTRIVKGWNGSAWIESK